MNFKTLYTAVILAIVLFASCKKDGGGGTTDNETVEKLATILSVHSGAAKAYADEFSISGDTIDALDAMGQYIVYNDAVDEAYYVGVEAVEIYYKNGLRSSIVLTPVDADGHHLKRGGGGGSALTAFKNSAPPEIIKNEKALVLVPFVDQFYYGNYNKTPMFKLGNKQMEVDVVTGANVTLDHVNSMSDYGFIILNTHGMSYGFMLYSFVADPQEPTGDEWTTEEALAVLEAHTDLPMAKFANGELEVGMNMLYQKGSKESQHNMVFVVTEKYIRNSSLNLTDAVVLGNFCYSGYTFEGPDKNNMPQAFKSKGVATYYGYAFDNGFSIGVDDDFAKRMEDSLILNLTQNNDSTALAHLANDADKQFYTPILSTTQKELVQRAKRLFAPVQQPTIPFYFQKYHSGNYAYEVCQDTLVDRRDGTVYKVVCIGDQTWMGENLKFSAHDSIGVCYDSLASNCDIYGRLYSQAEVLAGNSPASGAVGVRGICPHGWHIPTNEEWAKLEITLGVAPSEAQDFTLAEHGANVEAGSQLMSTSGWAPTNDPEAPSPTWINRSGFSAPPAGSWDNGFDPFSPPGWLTGIWTSSLHPGETALTFRRLHHTKSALQLRVGTYAGITYRVSCRCVKD